MLRDAIIILLIFIGILVWHPWASMDENVEEAIEIQLGTEAIFDRSWTITGERVVFYNESMVLGYLDVGYFDDIDTVFTYRGKISPYGLTPLPEDKGDFDYELGDRFIFKEEYSPSRLIQRYGCQVIYDPDVLKPTNITNGTLFYNNNITPTFQYEHGMIIYRNQIATDNMSIKPGTIIEVEFEVIGVNNTYVVIDEFFTDDGETIRNLSPMYSVYVIK